MQIAPLILTLKLDPVSAQRFNGLREKYFPSTLNFLPAHITLFHHLPGNELDSVVAALEQVTAGLGPISIRVDHLRSLGRGVAYNLQARPLSDLRDRLARQWSSWLTPQDRQSFRPHVTVQNKVSPPEALHTLALLQAAFTPYLITGIGLDLWRYLGGPWEHLQEFPFRQAE